MNAFSEPRPARFSHAWLSASVLSLFLAGWGIQPTAALSATLISADQASRVVSIRNLKLNNGAVSGELVNNSSQTLRDVQLLIRYTWLWSNEFHPGEDNAGTAIYYTVEGEIAPGGSKPFTYRVSLPSRGDGRFEASASVAGFSEIFR